MHIHPETSPTKWASTHCFCFPTISFLARYYCRKRAYLDMEEARTH